MDSSSQDLLDSIDDAVAFQNAFLPAILPAQPAFATSRTPLCLPKEVHLNLLHNGHHQHAGHVVSRKLTKTKNVNEKLPREMATHAKQKVGSKFGSVQRSLSVSQTATRQVAATAKHSPTAVVQ